jgi:molecular chaperone GrpE
MAERSDPKHTTEELDPTSEEHEERPGAAAASDAEPALPPIEAELVDLRRERDSIYDRLRRQAAEFDNYRKRIERERKETSEYAAVDLLEALLPIIDDFERALQAEAALGAETYRQGLEIILRELHELLRKRGVTSIEAVGADFDPHLHQAVAYEEAPNAREGEVIGEFRRGYRLGDRLLRPAMVKVAKA